MVRIFVNCDKLVGDEDAWKEMHFDSLLAENKPCVCVCVNEGRICASHFNISLRKLLYFL